jgi:glycosyltransferase involved in cell wall biosynthesis
VRSTPLLLRRNAEGATPRPSRSRGLAARNLRGNERMRVLHIVAPGEIGGLERVVELLGPGQAHDCAEVHAAVVLEPGGANHELVASLTAGGVTCHPIAVSSRGYLRERAAILALARRVRPDVVHTHGCRPDVVDATAVRGMGIPTVTTVHGFIGGGWRNRLYERLQRRAYRSFDAVVAVSRPLGEQLIRDRVPADRIHVVQNAWQESAPPLDRGAARRGLGVSAQGFRIGWVGRLSAEKGLDVLVDALAYLTDLSLSVSVVGNGPEQQSLLARAIQLGVDHQIRWHGLVPDAGRQFRAFDVYVLSSHTEGTPIVLFEAMAAGVPIVAANVGGVPDVVSSAEAVLVPPANPGALAEAVRAVYRDQAAARIRAQRARERLLTEFTVPPWVGRYDAIYRLVTNQAPAAVAV